MVNFVDFFLPSDRTGTDLAFLLCAIAGSLFFFLKVALVAFGGGIDGEGSDVDHGSGDAHAAGEGFDSIDALKVVSVNSVAAFFAIFGWAGLSAHVQFKLGLFLSCVVALFFGLLAMWAVAYMFYGLQKLTSAGAVFRLEDAIGKDGEVYERIPSAGRGKVHLTVNGMLREISAESSDGSAIDSFVTVRVTGLKGSNVIVEQLNT